MAKQNEVMPKGAKSSDATGEKREPKRMGVAVPTDKGKGEFNVGNIGEAECYSHKRIPHDQDGM